MMGESAKSLNLHIRVAKKPPVLTVQGLLVAVFCFCALPMEKHVNAPMKFQANDPIACERLVVIGNGMAGCRAVEEILARDPTRYAITIFGAEPRV
ncbi:MAG: hypothetical protein RLY97_1225, partial [Pseudomonadota bacterium]